MNKFLIYFRITALYTLFFASGDVAHAQNSRSPLLLDPAVKTGKLANGFTYYIRHNEEPKDRVVMYLVNKVGSVLEDEDQRGLAHFTEHMNFNGTVHFPHNELVNYLQKAGVRFGADINAYTSFDETVYQLPLPTNKPGLVDTGLNILRDWAQNAILDPAEIDRERGVVLEEKRLGKGASERMQRKLWPILLNNSRYANRMPIGTDTVLNNFQRPQIARFYNDWYRPDLQALVIVGDVDIKEMEQKIKKEFGDLKNPKNERARAKFTVPLTGKNQFIAVTDKEMTNTVAEVMIKHPAEQLRSESDYRREVVKNLYNQMLRMRFNELSRSATPPYISGNVSIAQFIGGLNVFDAMVVAKPGELEKGFKAVWREVVRVRRFGFGQAELDRAKATYLSSMVSQFKEKDKTSSDTYVSEYQQHFLKGIAAPGIDKEYQMLRSFLPGVTLYDMNAVSNDFIKTNDRTLLLMAPEKDKGSLPSEGIMKSWLSSVEAEKLTPHKDNVSEKPLLAKAPVAGKILTKTKNAGTDTYTYMLSNGVKVILKPTKFKNDEIVFHGFKSGGSSLSSDANYQSASLSGNLIGFSGVGNYNQSQLENYVSGKQLQVAPYVGTMNEGIQGSSTTHDLETALALSYAYITEPRKDKAVFDGLIAKSKAGLTNRSNDPRSVYQDTVNATLYNNNVRRTGPSIAKIDQMDLDSAYSFYKQRFADATGMVFTFVGSIDTNTIAPLIEKYIASLPAHNVKEEAADLHITVTEGHVSKNVYKGSEPQSSVLLFFTGKMEYSQQNTIKLDALKEALEIRLLERLREDESGVYTPGVYASSTKLPQNRYSFTIQFGCAPQNVDKLIASTLDEINKLKENGPSVQNLEKWRAENRSSRETEIKTNNFWLNYLSSQMNNKEPLDQLNSFDNIRDGIKPSDVKEAAKTYLSGVNYIRLVLLPESK